MIIKGNRMKATLGVLLKTEVGKDESAFDACNRVNPDTNYQRTRTKLAESKALDTANSEAVKNVKVKPKKAE